MERLQRLNPTPKSSSLSTYGDLQSNTKPQQKQPLAVSMKINFGQTGISYEKIFGEYLRDPSLTEIKLEDPYIRYF